MPWRVPPPCLPLSASTTSAPRTVPRHAPPSEQHTPTYETDLPRASIQVHLCPSRRVFPTFSKARHRTHRGWRCSRGEGVICRPGHACAVASSSGIGRASVRRLARGPPASMREPRIPRCNVGRVWSAARKPSSALGGPRLTTVTWHLLPRSHVGVDWNTESRSSPVSTCRRRPLGSGRCRPARGNDPDDADVCEPA